MQGPLVQLVDGTYRALVEVAARPAPAVWVGSRRAALRRARAVWRLEAQVVRVRW